MSGCDLYQNVLPFIMQAKPDGAASIARQAAYKHVELLIITLETKACLL